ncbi:MAG: alanine dehydrogenase [Candidatus Marinimicrobia bacterium]|nr:alanine dehydrogenase [Candidatus Neomarinimicrobiota bacterium]|tara:strand:- start:844 stop:1941 length:1098 start_codon:yes stop_codon:yes gene_type:complete
MIIGIPKEVKNNEKRVALTPHGASELIEQGHTVYIQKNAGKGSGFLCSDYECVGAKIIPEIKDVYLLSDLIVKVKEPQPEEVKMIKAGQIVFTFFHFAADEILTQSFIKSGAIAVAYETIEALDGSLPILIPMSEVAGRMSVQNGAKCLEGSMGGKGKLLSGVPGVEPAVVTVLGAGVVGYNAAKLAAGLGAQVNILDINMSRLRYIDDIMPENVTTVYSNSHNLKNTLTYTDLLIGAVLIPGAKAPRLISRKMLSLMKSGSVIVDVAVDQGGCVETCKPTTHENPTYMVDGILHYCVSNMPGAVPYTSTLALTNVTLPYVKLLASKAEDALQSSMFKGGVNIFKGKVAHKGVSEAFNLPYSSLY